MKKKTKLWAKLVAIRLEKLQMPQAELARQMDVSRKTISELIKYGKGSDDLKQRVSVFLNIAGWI